MRLIDADKVIGDLTAMKDIIGYDAILIDAMIDGLKRQATIDAVEVVRCKDCKHKGWIQEPCHGKSVDFCNVFDSVINNPEKCFCYYGERRKNERSNQERGSV